ncbi:MAG: SCP2 sterol-binding domain-containing protein [Litorilinea sp.]
MAVFESEEQFYTAMQAVFAAVSQQPEHIETFTRSNLVIRMNFTNPTAEVLLDGRQPPLEVFYGPRPGTANIEVTLDAELLHRIWLGQVSASQSFFSGAIQTQGNVMRALPLMDLFRVCEEVYPTVVENLNLDS